MDPNRLKGKNILITGAARGMGEANARSFAAQGGNVRVGLEDSIWLEKGVLAPSSAAQVTKAREIIEGLGRRAATPAEARAKLALKGSDNTAF